MTYGNDLAHLRQQFTPFNIPGNSVANPVPRPSLNPIPQEGVAPEQSLLQQLSSMTGPNRSTALMALMMQYGGGNQGPDQVTIDEARRQEEDRRRILDAR